MIAYFQIPCSYSRICIFISIASYRRTKIRNGRNARFDRQATKTYRRMHRRREKIAGRSEAKQSCNYYPIDMERSHGEATIRKVQKPAKTIEKTEEIK